MGHFALTKTLFDNYTNVQYCIKLGDVISLTTEPLCRFYVDPRRRQIKYRF